MSLKARLARPEILAAPGVYDGLTAALAEQAGFEELQKSDPAYSDEVDAAVFVAARHRVDAKKRWSALA